MNSFKYAYNLIRRSVIPLFCREEWPRTGFYFAEKLYIHENSENTDF